jgi:TRAP transporter T-component
MSIYRFFIFLSLILTSVCTLSSCAVRPFVANQVADALANSGQANEEDLVLAREASAFYLKLSESVLRQSPANLKLAEVVTAGFTQYAYAFVSFEADQMQAQDAKAAHRMRERAGRLYNRAFEHAMTALEQTSPGFRDALNHTSTGRVLALKPEQIGVAHWAAAAWGGLISMSKDDPEKVADLPLAMELARLAWQLKPDHADGGLTSLMGTFEAAKPGGSLSAAEKYFDLAIAQSKGQSAGPWVAKAESIALARADQESFEKWLKQAIQVSEANRKLENEVMRARAIWLLEKLDELF